MRAGFEFRLPQQDETPCLDVIDDLGLLSIPVTVTGDSTVKLLRADDPDGDTYTNVAAASLGKRIEGTLTGSGGMRMWLDGAKLHALGLAPRADSSFDEVLAKVQALVDAMHGETEHFVIRFTLSFRIGTQ